MSTYASWQSQKLIVWKYSIAACFESRNRLQKTWFWSPADFVHLYLGLDEACSIDLWPVRPLQQHEVSVKTVIDQMCHFYDTPGVTIPDLLASDLVNTAGIRIQEDSLDTRDFLATVKICCCHTSQSCTDLFQYVSFIKISVLLPRRNTLHVGVEYAHSSHCYSFHCHLFSQSFHTDGHSGFKGHVLERSSWIVQEIMFLSEQSLCHYFSMKSAMLLSYFGYSELRVDHDFATIL